MTKVSQALKDMIPQVEALEALVTGSCPYLGLTICIDPGHGGRDPGAVDGFEETLQDQINTYEKYLNLAMGLSIGEMLTAEGMRVLYTRTTDIELSLESRCRIANESNCHLLLSCHHNWFRDPKVSGVETFIYKEGGKAEQIAGYIQTQLVRTTHSKNRGVKTANFGVLRETKMPAVLVEFEFISNPEAERLVNEPSWRRDAASAVVRGTLEFLKGEGI